MIRGVCQRGRSTYRRFKVKRDGKWTDLYVKLPDPSDPSFATELARIEGKPAPRAKPIDGSIAALIAEYRLILAKQTMAESTRKAWNYYLGLIEEQHGKRLVADLERSHCYKIRDSMIDEPGKSNSYMAKFKALLEFATEREWIKDNPARGIPLFELGEYAPWPPHVLREAIDAASPMLRLSIISGLCSGQRISDCILMQHGWHDGRLMELRSQKTDMPAVIPMHPIWLREIASVRRRAVTLLYDRAGKPFKDTDRLQAQIRRLMRSLGCVVRDKQGNPLDKHGNLVTTEAGNQPEILYSFHGLSKNAICYLTELGLDESTIEAIVGKTPETIRHYAKETRRWMLAEAAADKVIAGRIERLVGKSAGNVGKVYQ